MSNSHYNYYDPEFNPAEAAGNELAILITGSVFGFTVMEMSENKILVWGEGFDLTELAEPDSLKEVLLAAYTSVKVAYQTLGFTVVPRLLFNEHKIADYARFLTKEPGDSIMADNLDNDNYVVFKVDAQTSKIVTTHYDIKNICFAGRAWVAGVNFARPYNEPVYLNVQSSFAQFLYYKDNKLIFYNAFEFNNPDELMYYTVLVSNELGLNLDSTSLLLSGDITHSDKKIHRLNEMLPKVYFNQNKVVNLPAGFISHQILMLAGLSLCGSLVAD